MFWTVYRVAAGMLTNVARRWQQAVYDCYVARQPDAARELLCKRFLVSWPCATCGLCSHSVEQKSVCKLKNWGILAPWDVQLSRRRNSQTSYHEQIVQLVVCLLVGCNANLFVSGATGHGRVVSYDKVRRWYRTITCTTSSCCGVWLLTYSRSCRWICDELKTGQFARYCRHELRY